MAGDSSDVSKHVKLYLGVFGALAVLTVLTVTASQMDASQSVHVGVAIAIAAIKASLVAIIFMHLKWEKASTLWSVLILSAFFFVVLLALPVLTVNDHPPGVVMGTWSETG